MKRKYTVGSLSLLLLLIFTTACGQATETPTSAPALTAAPTNTQLPLATGSPAGAESPAVTESPAVSPQDGMPVTGSGQCANAYFPVREGATWTYSSTGGPMGGYGFTDTVTSVREDGFTLTSQFEDLTRTQEWGCRPEGLVALQLGGASAATLNSDNMVLNLDVDNVSGVTFPREIQPGDTWQHALTFTGKITIAGQEIDATGDAQSSFRAVDFESVTVPAGTFDALKVHIDTTINIKGDLNGISFPVRVTTPYDYWFVQGVGWVKASGTGSLSGQSFSETIELQSYSIP